MNANEYKIEKGYFRNNPNCGRITNLIKKNTGEKIYSAMGICTKKQLINSLIYGQLMNTVKFYN